MASGPLKCADCKVGELVEFKPGSLVCTRCDKVFHLTPAAPAAPAPASAPAIESASIGTGCQKDGCGGQVWGCCERCGQQYCQAHSEVLTTKYARHFHTHKCGPCSRGEYEARQQAEYQRASAERLERQQAEYAKTEARSKLRDMTARDLEHWMGIGDCREFRITKARASDVARAAIREKRKSRSGAYVVREGTREKGWQINLGTFLSKRGHFYRGRQHGTNVFRVTEEIPSDYVLAASEVWELRCGPNPSVRPKGSNPDRI